MLNIHNKDILFKALIGFEFEFFSNYDLDEAVKQLKSLLGRDIYVGTKAHSEFQPTDKKFKVEPDMSGGKNMLELVTGALPYQDARMVLIKVLTYIKEHGYTTDRSAIHINCSFDIKQTGDPYRIKKMNVLKFILDFNEPQVYKFFPNRENSVYAKSIKWILPRAENFYFDGNTISQMNFEYPMSKYYGINFSKAEKGYLEFRYLGGKDYQDRTTDLLHLTDVFLLQMWNATENPGFTPNNKLELKRILELNKNVIEGRKDWRKLFTADSNIKLTIDMDDSDVIVDMYWPQIRDRVIKLFTHGGIEGGRINYDTDAGKIQIKDAFMKMCFELEVYEFVDCKIRGSILSSDFYNCEIEGSDIKFCALFQGTNVKESKLQSCYVSQSVFAENCYVFGIDGYFEGQMQGGIFREGRYTHKADFIDVEIVQSKKIEMQ
jgi:hypothetical protein